MGNVNSETVSEAQEVFTRTCAEWLNVIGQLSQAPSANEWTSNFCSHLARYIEDGAASVRAGEVPGDQLAGFCDTETWLDLARAVAMEVTDEEESAFALAAVRTLNRAYEYHSAEEGRRVAAFEAAQKAKSAAREERVQ